MIVNEKQRISKESFWKWYERQYRYRTKREREHNLPKIVFHSLRHSSVTYKLKLNGGDIKSVQGDSGHSQVDMGTNVYSHIIDEDRRHNADRFEGAATVKKKKSKG